MFYKVVTIYRNKLVSSVVFDIEDLCIEYKVGEWTEPKGNTKIFIIKGLKNARKFRTHVGGGRFYKIYKCEAINPVQIFNAVKTKHLYDPSSKYLFEEYWNDKDYKKVHTLLYSQPPVGSYVADKIKLIKEVK